MNIIDKFFENTLHRLGYSKANSTPGFANYTNEWDVPDPRIYGNQSDLYRKLAWVQIAVNLVAQTAAGLSGGVYQRTGERKEEVINHDFEKLLEAPNELQTGVEFLTMCYSHYAITGNAYWWKNCPITNAAPIELIPIPPANIRTVPGKELGTLKGYIYTDKDGREHGFGPEEIVHFRRFNPHSVYVGLSPVEAIALDAQADMGMQKVNARDFSKEGGRIPSILGFKDTINDTDWEVIKRDIRKHEKDHQMMLLRGIGDGVDWKANVMSRHDMQYLESRNFTKEEIFNIFAPGAVSILSLNATEANAKTGKATLAENAIYPMTRVMGARITKDIMPLYGDDQIYEIEDPRVNDTELELKEITVYGQFHAIDEVRSKYWGDKPLPEVGTLLASQVNAQPSQEIPEMGVEDVQLKRQKAEVVQMDMTEDLNKWERKATKRAKSGKEPACEFDSETIPEGIADMVMIGLEHADCPDCVKAVFEDVRHFVQKKDLPERSKKFTPRIANPPYRYAPGDTEITEKDIRDAVKTWDKLMPEFEGLLDAQVKQEE